MIHILLVDDHAIIRDGVKSMLKEEPTLTVVGEASNGQEMLDLLEHEHPEVDVVLMDINMPVMDGYEATLQLKKHYPDIKVLALSMLDHERYILKMFDAGATGYGLKSMRKVELIHGLRMVAEGNKFICSEISFNLVSRLDLSSDVARDAADKPGSELSKREVEVLRLIAEGLTAAQVADKLFTSKRTIESHRQNLLEKTQSKNTASLIRYAANAGLLD